MSESTRLALIDLYANIQKFMMDLNPENNTLVLEFISLIVAKKIIECQRWKRLFLCFLKGDVIYATI